MLDGGLSLKNSSGWNSNTPFPKRLKGKCPANEIGVPCMGYMCRFIKKSCAYSLLKSNMVIGRQAVKRLKAEGFEVL
jgi:hypothetical protein